MAHERQVRQIVSDTAHLVRTKPRLAQHLAIRGQLVGCSLYYQADLELGGPYLDNPRTSAGDDRRALAQGMPELQSRAIAHMKLLQLQAAVTVHDAAVRQHAVDIQHQQFDAPAAVRDGWR